jgi:predicted MFS family arabinose efflux permease
MQLLWKRVINTTDLGVAGFSPGAVTWLLVLFGGGLVVGNLRR